MTESDRLGQLLAEWQELISCGPPPDREAFLAGHPDDAAALRAHMDLLPVLDLAFLPRLRLPEQVGPYRILRAIGSGGMGTVYLARAGDSAGVVPPGTTVALKVPHAHLLSRPDFVARFLREGELGRRVCHENVVRTYGADTIAVDGVRVPYLVTEFAEGRTLRALLDDFRQVPETLLREIARQIAAGLAAIHAAGVVHRDVKPENVVLTAEHRVRIMDLGVARPVDITSALTHAGQFAGTLLYAAPEQFRGGKAGPAADLYALGVVLYELGSGGNPFWHAEPAAVMTAQLESTPPPLSRLEPPATPFFSEVVSTLLRKRPEDRFPSAAALAAVLENGEQDPWWTERQEETGREPRRRPALPVTREARLHGREEDLAALAAAWAGARAGQGGLVLVEGEAGIGKTRLLDAFLSGIPEGVAHLLYGSYPPLGGTGALAESVVAHFGRPHLLERLKACLPGRESMVQGLVSILLREALPAGVEPLSLEAATATAVDVLCALSEEAPLCWVVEDVHNAGADSHAMLLALARAARGRRVLLVASCRPGLRPEFAEALRRMPPLARRQLRRLDPAEVTDILREVLRNTGLAERLGGRIARKSDGIPFFVLEAVRSLREAKLLTQRPDRSYVETAPISEIQVPSAVRDLIGTWLEGFSVEERTILGIAAVAGYEFDPDLVARVLGENRVLILERLGEIERRSGVVRADGRVYRFDHHQFMEVVYGTLPLPLREEYHTLLADACAEAEHLAGLDPAQVPAEKTIFLTFHHLRGRDPRRALPLLDRALTILSDSSRLDHEIELIDTALARPDLLDAAGRVRLFIRKANRFDSMGRPVEQGAAATEAARLAETTGDEGLSGDADRALGMWFATVGRWADAEAALHRAVAHHGAAGLPSLEGQDRVSLSYVLRHVGRHEEARREAEEVLASARRSEDLALEGSAEECLGTLHGQQGRFAESWACFTRRLEISRRIGDRAGERSALLDLGLQKVHTGQHEEARRYLADSLRFARAAGHRSGEAASLAVLGMSHLRCGETEPARDHLERALSVYREVGHRVGEGSTAGHLGMLHLSLGHGEKAREYAQLFLTLTRQTEDRVGEALALTYLGTIQVVLGNLEGARGDLETALAASREKGLRRVEGLALHGLGLFAEASGDPAAARGRFDEALALRRALGDAPGIAASLLRLGGLDAGEGRAAEAKERLAEALRIGREADASDVVLLAGRRLEALGAPVEDDLAAREAKAGVATRMEARFVSFQSSGSRADLDEARRLLALTLDHAPADGRSRMPSQVELHRRILAAAAGPAPLAGSSPV